MQLVERGQLDLDAPAGGVCEQLADPQVLEGFSGDGEPILRPTNTPVTLRSLLTHRPGFAYDIWNADMARYLDATGTPALTSGQRAALDVPLMFDPGSQWECGIGIDWVGQMIEQVSGMSLGEYFAENLTGPLGMVDTAFSPTASMTTRAATVHARLADGGLHATMIDYSRFIRLMLNGGELDGSRVLAAQTVALMAQNHMGDLRVRPMPTQVAAYSCDAEFFPGSPKSWGLSFQINEEQAFTGRPPGTLMWAGLANSYFWIDPTNGIGGCYLSQIFPFVDPRTLGTFLAFETGVYASHQG